ncbi:MAG: FlgD immunoglobulin-like domain containing protein [Candidatus Nanohaloarchaea archaeon]
MNNGTKLTTTIALALLTLGMMTSVAAAATSSNADIAPDFTAAGVSKTYTISQDYSGFTDKQASDAIVIEKPAEYSSVSPTLDSPSDSFTYVADYDGDGADEIVVEPNTNNFPSDFSLDLDVSTTTPSQEEPYTFTIRTKENGGVISTKDVTTTVDDTKPVSSIDSLNISSPTKESPWKISYSSSDNENDFQSGVSHVRLRVDTPDGDNTFEQATTSSDGAFEYAPSSDGEYRFKTVAVDNVGNEEASEDVSTTSVTYDTTEPSLSGPTVTDSAFSPNGDGVQDSTAVKFTPSDNLASTIEYGVIIKDGSGNQVKKITGAVSSGSAVSETWKGTDSNGDTVPDGNYTVEVVVADDVNLEATGTTSVEVDTANPAVTSGTIDTEIASNEGTSGIVSIGDTIKVTDSGVSYDDKIVSKTVNLQALGLGSMTPLNTETGPVASGNVDSSSKTFTVTIEDDAGNTAQINTAGTEVDNQPPKISGISPAAGSQISAIVDLSSSEGTGDSISSSSWSYSLDGGSSWAAINDADTGSGGVQWDTTSLADQTGVKLKNTREDDAGNSGSGSVGNLEIDNQPAEGLTATPSVERPGDAVLLNATATPGSTVTFAYDNGGYTKINEVTASSKGFATYSWTVPSVSQGSYTVAAQEESLSDFSNFAADVTTRFDVDTKVDTFNSLATTISGSDNTLKVGEKVNVSVTAADSFSGIDSVTVDASCLGDSHNGQEELSNNDGDTYWKVLEVTSGDTDGTCTLSAVARDVAGNQANELTADLTVDNRVPAQVTGTTAKAVSGGGISVNWRALHAGDIDHYKIYRKAEGGPFGSHKQDTSPPTTDELTTHGTTYYYKVSAVDDAGNEGRQSSQANATADAMDPNVTGAVTTSNTEVEVTVEDPVSGVDTETIERSDFNLGGSTVDQISYTAESTVKNSLTVTLTAKNSFTGGVTPDVSMSDVSDAADNTQKGQTFTKTSDGVKPSVSGVSLDNDGSNNLQLSFESDEQLSDIKVSVEGPSDSDYSFNEADFTVSGTGPYTYTLSTSTAYGDEGSYTATVEKAEDDYGNDGASGQSDIYSFAPADVTAAEIDHEKSSDSRTVVDLRFEGEVTAIKGSTVSVGDHGVLKFTDGQTGKDLEAVYYDDGQADVLETGESPQVGSFSSVGTYQKYGTAGHDFDSYSPPTSTEADLVVDDDAGYGSDSDATTYASIQNAVEAASDGDVIVVKNGTYGSEGGRIALNANGRSITIAAENRGGATLQGTLNLNGDRFNVKGFRFEGLVVYNGDGAFTYNTVVGQSESDSGVQVFAPTSADVTISNNLVKGKLKNGIFVKAKSATVTQNTVRSATEEDTSNSYVDGAGIKVIEDEGDTVSITGNKVLSSDYGVVADASSADLAVTGSRFVDIRKDDVYTNGATVSATGNWFGLNGIQVSGSVDASYKQYDTAQGDSTVVNTFRRKLEANEINLVSFPLAQNSLSYSEGTNGLASGAVNSVWAYDSSANSWTTVESGDSFRPGRGYVFSLGSKPSGAGSDWNELVVNSKHEFDETSGDGPAAPGEFELAEGWNLIGHYQEFNEAASDALSSVSDSYAGVFNKELDSVSKLETGKGYWVTRNDDNVYTQ